MSETIDLGSVQVTLSSAPTTGGKATGLKTTTYTSLEDLAAAAPFDVLLPGLTLRGHDLLDAAMITDPSPTIALTFAERSTGRHYIIVESPIASAGSGDKPDVRAVGETIAANSLGAGQAARVTSAAPPGTPRPSTLLWAKEGLLLQLTGIGYAEADMEQVALSL